MIKDNLKKPKRNLEEEKKKESEPKERKVMRKIPEMEARIGQLLKDVKILEANGFFF